MEEPGQQTTRFGIAASGGVVKFPVRPRSGVFSGRGNVAHFPITARPEYGTPALAEPIDGALYVWTFDRFCPRNLDTAAAPLVRVPLLSVLAFERALEGSTRLNREPWISEHSVKPSCRSQTDEQLAEAQENARVNRLSLTCQVQMRSIISIVASTADETVGVLLEGRHGSAPHTKASTKERRSGRPEPRRHNGGPKSG